MHTVQLITVGVRVSCFYEILVVVLNGLNDIDSLIIVLPLHYRPSHCACPVRTVGCTVLYCQCTNNGM